MSYSHYKKTLSDLIHKKEPCKLEQFARDVITRITLLVKNTSTDSLFEAEENYIGELLDILQQTYPDLERMQQILDDLTRLFENNEIHAIEIDMEFIEFLSALDSWLAFRKTGNKMAIAQIAEHIMNILDYYYTNDVSLDNWLSVKEIKQEFDKQISFLEKIPNN